MAGYRYDLKRYFKISKDEWVSVLIASFVAGFVLSYNDWGGETFSFTIGITNLILDFLGALFFISFHLAANKAIAIFYGIWSDFERYGLGLLTGVFISFLTFGYVPIWITGYYRYKTIPNLRLGKFRATLVKPWEEGMITAGTVFAILLMTIPLGLLYNVTGVDFFFDLVKIGLLLAIYTMIPLPLIQTTNVYQVYMSRLETLEGNLPGYDLFFASPTFYFFVLGVTLGFAGLMFIFGASWLSLLLSLILGLVGIWIYTGIRGIQRLG